VTLYPEGTTTIGEDVLPFHARLFGAAIDAGVPVQPVALRFGSGDGGARIAPFVGDDDLVSHVGRLLLNRRLTVTVTFCAPMASGGTTRESLANACRDRIRDALLPARPDFAALDEPAERLAA
jgi:1-acyl-sn-glycerol-3-phosphate acyltransferase